MSISEREQRAADEAYAAFSSVVRTGAATVIWLPELPMVPMLNRVVGLGSGHPATEADVDAALAAIEPGVSYYVAVAPHAEPPRLPEWLRARGLEPGWGWMAFRRGVDDPPEVETTLELVEVEAEPDVAAFARVVRESYGLPPAADPVLANAARSPWRCWLALENGEPIAAAGLFVSGGIGYLGIGATLTGHRGKGAQTALLAARIRQAGTLGCDLVTTETGEREGGRPSNSYRNILRAGFEEVAVTANWRGSS